MKFIEIVALTSIDYFGEFILKRIVPFNKHIIK